MHDQLTTCKHCGSDACYIVENSSTIKTYACMGCGFSTNSIMKEGEEFYNQQLEILPEIYKAVIFKDEDGLMWIPSVTNIPDKGMVFVNGGNKDNWQWVGVLAVPVKEEEKHKYPVRNMPGKYYEWRMSMETMKSFGQRGFMDALEYIKVLPSN